MDEKFTEHTAIEWWRKAKRHLDNVEGTETTVHIVYDPVDKSHVVVFVTDAPTPLEADEHAACETPQQVADHIGYGVHPEE